jgi:pre-rRNA-processing protein IPI1
MSQAFNDWLIHLPQVLWEIGGSDPMATEVWPNKALADFHF